MKVLALIEALRQVVLHKTNILIRASFELGSLGLAKRAVCSACAGDGRSAAVTKGERSQPGQATAKRRGVGSATPLRGGFTGGGA